MRAGRISIASRYSYSAINRHRGFNAFFGSTWAQIIAMDVGGSFTASGDVTLIGDGVIDGGSFQRREGYRQFTCAACNGSLSGFENTLNKILFALRLDSSSLMPDQ